MKKQVGKYFLKLILVGVIPILIVSATIAVTFLPSKNPTFYDFGVPILIIGIGVALLSLYVLSSASSWRKRLEDYLPEEARGQGVRDGSKDFLWTTMITGIILGLSGFGLINTSLDQGIRTPDPETRPSVSSLRGELPLHEEEAKKWAKDAYLYSADVSMVDNTWWIIFSIYEAKSEPYDFIFIYTENDGSITTDINTSNTPLRHTEPIIESDWTIDSQDAIDVFLQDEEIHKCIMSNRDTQDVSIFNSIELSLERVIWIKDSPAAWILSLSDNCNVEHRYIVLDAKTGEIIGKR